MTVQELAARIDRGERPHLLDVRSAREFAAGHVPGAVNVPFTKVASSLAAVPGVAADELILYCGHGPRAFIAATMLRARGWKRIIYLRGHWSAWKASQLRIER